MNSTMCRGSEFFQFSDEVSDNADDEDETTDDSETALGEYFCLIFEVLIN